MISVIEYYQRSNLKMAIIYLNVRDSIVQITRDTFIKHTLKDEDFLQFNLFACINGYQHMKNIKYG